MKIEHDKRIQIISGSVATIYKDPAALICGQIILLSLVVHFIYEPLSIVVNKINATEPLILIEFKRESKCRRPAMSETVAAKEASAVDTLFSLVFHDHPTQSTASFDLILS